MYSIEHRTSRRLLPALTAAFLLVLAGLAFAKSAAAEVIYDNIEPESRILNPASLGYEATGTNEFGSQVTLAGEARHAPEVEVLMSVWSCQTGTWNSGCTTTPGSTFAAPLTLNVYEVGAFNEVGTLIESVPKTFNLEYRPSGDPSCSDPTAFKNAEGHCQHGKPEPVTFNLTSTLPRRVILSVAFTTADYGPGHTGDESTPMNSLNVGLEGPPAAGQNPTEALSGVYWATSTFSDHSGLFHYTEEPSEWAVGESQIAARISAAGPVISLPPPPSNGSNGASGNNGANGTNGANGASGGEGSVALKRKMSLKFHGGKATVSDDKASVKVRCLGSTDKRCVGTLKLTVGGKSASSAYSVAAGKNATVKVPLGGIDVSSAGASPTAAAVARTVQSSGGATTTKRTLQLG